MRSGAQADETWSEPHPSDLCLSHYLSPVANQAQRACANAALDFCSHPEASTGLLPDRVNAEFCLATLKFSLAMVTQASIEFTGIIKRALGPAYCQRLPARIRKFSAFDLLDVDHRVAVYTDMR